MTSELATKVRRPKTDEGRITVTTKLLPDHYAVIERIAEERDTPIASIVREALLAYIKGK